MKRTLTAVVIALALLPVCAFAQPGGMPGPGPRAWDRIEQLRRVRLIEMLELTEDQSARFIARLKDSEDRRRELMKQRDEQLDKIERLLRNRSDAKEFTDVFAQVDSIDQRILDEKRQFRDGLADLLNIEQRAKLLLFERRFERELRDAFREAQRRRHRGEGD